MSGTQISARDGGVITVIIAVLLFFAAFAWMRYSTGLQELGSKMMRRTVRLPDSRNIHFRKFTRWYGVIFLSVIGVISFLVGLVEIITNR